MGDSVGVRYQNVVKTYHHGGEETSVLRGVTFDVQPGGYVALMGPSGSGKSTILNLTAGLDHPSSGHVLVGATDPATLSGDALSDWRRHNVGFIFQRYHLINVLRAGENVELPLMAFGLSTAERKRRVRSALELVGLLDKVDSYPTQLSGGQEQRVSIARALVADPQVLLADEPTGDLDAKSAQEILDLLDTLTSMGKTLLVVTHDPNVAKRAHRTLYLQKGVFSEIQV